MQKTVLLCETIRRNCPAISVSSFCMADKPEGTFCGAAVDDSIMSRKKSFTRCSERKSKIM